MGRINQGDRAAKGGIVVAGKSTRTKIYFGLSSRPIKSPPMQFAVGLKWESLESSATCQLGRAKLESH